MIYIVGLGPGNEEALTLGALKLLKSSPSVVFRTLKHPTVDYLFKQGISGESCDNFYEEKESFDEVYKGIVEYLWQKKDRGESIIYAVPGHPLVAEKTVSLLINRCKLEGIPYRIIPAVSFVDAMMEALEIDAVEGIKIIDAFEMSAHQLDRREGTIITQVYNNFIASEVKLSLQGYYKDNKEIYFVRAAGIPGEESIRKINLYDLDRQQDIDYLTSIYIPKDEEVMDFKDLVDIMAKLRAQGGCPWDREQTHESLKRYLIEECYEVLEAIDLKDEDKMVEELGDVLLQVVFHASIGAEEGYFQIGDITQGICQKLIYRHPHIFGKVQVESSKEVLKNWEEIKKVEKGYNTYTEELKQVPKNLPALMRAEKIQKKAARVGFDWEKIEDAMSKVLEELDEVKGVYKGKSRERILEEVGDLIFSTVNISRFLDIDPENALNYTIEKFIHRFSFIEQEANQKGIELDKMSLQEMDSLWEESKKYIISQNT